MRRYSTEAVTAASYTATGAFSGKYPDAKLYTEYLIAACRCGRPEAAVESFESEVGLTLVHSSAQLVRFLWDKGCA